MRVSRVLINGIIVVQSCCAVVGGGGDGVMIVVTCWQLFVYFSFQSLSDF